MSEPTPPVLQLHGIDKSFTGVRALAQASLVLRAGEVHALMGQNGAGKSTLIKVLTGVHAADAGRMSLQGRAIAPDSPQAAQALGIATLYQEVNLCPNLSVAENIMAGRLPKRWGWIDWQATRRAARQALARLRMDIDERRLLADYPVAVQQMVAIARAIGREARVLVLDEPTSSLDAAETNQLFEAMRRLQSEGVAILFVTHFLDQVYEMADRITVMRDGRTVGEYVPAELPRLALVEAMIGRSWGGDALAGGGPGAISAAAAAATATATPGAGDAPRLAAQALGRRGAVHGLDFAVRGGEVVGLAGLLGSGRTEAARLLFGADRADHGRVRMDGAELKLRSPRDALRAGMAFCPEERKTEGIVAELSVRENIVLALQAQRGVLHFLPRAEQEALAGRLIEALGVKTADAETPIGHLSGGNQQKAILARWLATEPRVLILDEPTRGIDVAAQAEIMARVQEMCGHGMAIVFISSDLAEVLRVSHRIVVLRDRAQVAELAPDDTGALDERRLLEVIAGHDTAEGNAAHARRPSIAPAAA